MNAKIPIAILLALALILTGYLIRTDIMMTQTSVQNATIQITEIHISTFNLTSTTLELSLLINNSGSYDLYNTEAQYTCFLNNNTISTGSIGPINLSANQLTSTSTNITIKYQDLSTTGLSILQEFIDTINTNTSTALEFTISGTITTKAIKGILPLTHHFIATYPL